LGIRKLVRFAVFAVLPKSALIRQQALLLALLYPISWQSMLAPRFVAQRNEF
jgi:hypothetical protein